MEQTADEQREQTCYEKAKANCEPTFTLRAQDISADLVVDFWTTVQLEVRQFMDDGLTMHEAVARVERDYRVMRWSKLPPDGMQDAKIKGAMAIAREMSQFQNRKIAD